ncbi:hypothetical protein Tco_1542429, partial [Tanacetum coccineum]
KIRREAATATHGRASAITGRCCSDGGSDVNGGLAAVDAGSDAGSDGGSNVNGGGVQM